MRLMSMETVGGRRLLLADDRGCYFDEDNGAWRLAKTVMASFGPVGHDGSPAPNPSKEEMDAMEKAASTCPHCGAKDGFSWGTGNCGCDAGDYY